MKRRIVKCVAGACVAGMVLGTSGAGMAVAATPEADSWSAAENEIIVLYGPPSEIDEIDVPIPVLYGPPSAFENINPMQVETHNRSVAQSVVKDGKKTFKKAIVVKDAVGEVGFSKIAKGSSKCLSVNKKTGAVSVKKGTKVICLAQFQGWIYVEANVSGKTARGFISPSCLDPEAGGK